VTCEPGIHDHLLHLPMTSKEKRSVRLTQKLKPELTEDQALEFVRLFYWEIRNAPGGVEGLLKK
jgi:hypothetical protein